jgi:hypothetical protein
MVHCWDSPPPVPVGQDGWRNAIEISPTTIPHRQYYSGHHFDLSKDPVEIVWTVADISVADRKNGWIQNLNFEYTMEENRQKMDNEIDSEKLEAILAKNTPKIAVIEAATTHDALDALL